MNIKPRIICFIVTVASLIGITNSHNTNISVLNQKMEGFTEAITARVEVELVDTVSAYGKLNGNGNGIQYFGAALVKATSENDVSAIVGKLSSEYEIVGYSIQTGQEIESKYLEHVSLCFDDFTVNDDENCYQIFFYCSDFEDSDVSDIIGH